MPSTSSKKRRLSSGLGVSSSACPMWARSRTGSGSLALHPLAQPVHVVGQLAGREPRALDPLLLLALERRGEHLLARARSTTTTPSASSTTGSPGLIVAPPTSTGSSSAPVSDLPAPRTRIQRAHTGSPARAAPRRRARRRPPAAPTAPRSRAWVASRSPISATGSGSGIVSTSTSPGSARAIAACTIRLSPCPQRTVRAGPHAREPGISCSRSRSTSPRRPDAS